MQLYKVVWTDGYYRETIAQRVVSTHLDLLDTSIICNRLRSESKWDGNWWIIMPQDRPIWRGMAEFVDED